MALSMLCGRPVPDSSIDAFIEKFREVILPGFRMRLLLVGFLISQYDTYAVIFLCCD